jgi:hypothetical protein
MSNPETNLSNSIRLALGSVPTVRLFRNNVGTGWTGSKVIHHADGSVTIKDARPLHAGLAKGSADLIGWRTMPITAEMVGGTVAVFTSIEVKGRLGRVTADQQNWRDQVERCGGIAGVCRSVADAESIIFDFCP